MESLNMRTMNHEYTEEWRLFFIVPFSEYYSLNTYGQWQEFALNSNSINLNIATSVSQCRSYDHSSLFSVNVFKPVTPSYCEIVKQIQKQSRYSNSRQVT